VLVAILAQGHLLVEGVPGLAKTLTVKTLATTIQGHFRRIQFTPDLVPADLIGTRIYSQKTGEFSTALGPVFTNLLLADEINRAPAKVQSALLEVMQERQVTIAGETHFVPDPFLVMATQNPIETEGTYPLPEAQVDRFMMKVLVGYPTEEEEFVIVDRVTGPAIATGAVPNQVLVDGDFVYVVNAQSSTLQVARRGAGDGDAGLVLTTVQEFVFGANTFPQGAAKVGRSLWVPLYGGYGANTADAGQRVIEVNVENPTSPRATAEVSLKNLDLKAFDGGTPVARPFAIVAQRGQLYVALNNFNAECNPICVPGGPGLLAKIDPTTRAVTVIDLGADACLNPQWVATMGDALVVSCGGRANYTGQDFVLTSVSQAGVVVLDATDRRVATWAPAAPSCGDAGVCPLFLPGRFAVKGSSVFLGDQNAGRLVVLDFADGGLVERRGPARNDGLAVCPVNASGIANVADVLAP
jgi:hypothetical protein